MPVRKVEKIEKRSERIGMEPTKGTKSTEKTPIPKSVTHKQDEIALQAFEYMNKKKAISLLTKDCNKIRPTLETYMDSNEVELPTGSKECRLPYLDTEIIMKRTARNSAALRSDAMNVIRELGIADSVIKVKEYVDEDELARMISSGEISNEDALRLYEPTRTYAFSVVSGDKGGSDFDE